MYFPHSSATLSAAVKTHRLDGNFLKSAILRMPIHAVKRSLKSILVLVILFTFFGLFLLLHRSYQSSSSPAAAPEKSNPFPKDFANSIDNPKLWKVISNEEISKKDAANSNNKVTEVKEPIFIEKRSDIKQLAKNNEKSNIAISAQNSGKSKTLKHERIVNGMLSRVSKIKNQNKNYPKYYEDDLHPEWMFKISRTYDDTHLHYWTEPNRTVPKSELWTQGENGNGFVPKSTVEEGAMKELLKEHNYNIYASEHMPIRRSLPDYRYDECRNLTYPERLPNVSVVIVMHNEAWSTILRTIWSIIDRSPRELLHEIIVVDDVSTWKFLKRPLDDYVEMLPARVRILRTAKREGLIRARLIGAQSATGSILVFFDAHMECTEGWLQPIAARIANDRSVVAVPMIDGISSHDMSYGAAYNTQISGLRWHLIFNWMDIPQRELLRTKNDRTAPIRAPTHVGCAFAIDRGFFFEIGSYDTEMDIWGAENVEMAFRVWMCGGSLEVLPCSRVGHLYRISTYSFDGDQSLITARNTNRLIEVWMDEFKELFYSSNPKSKEVSPGDLTARKQLRKQLKCKNFRWYLEHIYPESTWLKDYTDMGELKSVSNDKCLDIDSTALNGKLRLWPCHGYGGNQFFAFEKSGLIVTVEEICVGVNAKKEVILVRCEGDVDLTKLWLYDKEQNWIINRDKGLCMQNRDRDVIVDSCNSTDVQTQWAFNSTATSIVMQKNMSNNL